MDGLEVNALFGVCLQHFQKICCLDVCQIFFQIADGIIHGNRADHCRRHLDQLFPEGVGLAVVGQIHDCLALELNRQLYLFKLSGIVVAVPGNAQVYVHLRAESLADAVGMQALVVDVRRNTDRTLCHTLPDQFRCQVFFLGDRLHFRCQNSLLCSIHLCCILCHIFLIPFCR